jgi:ribosomal protein L7/L12
MDLLAKVLIIVAIAIAILLLIDALNKGKVNRLRQSGIYPRPGEETDADVERLVRMKRKIEAIKIYRTIHDVGLKDAKEAVDRIDAEIRGTRGAT